MDKIIILFLISISGYAQIGLGTNSPHASATLELNSTSRGFLPPRMIEFQRDAITSPEAGLIYTVQTAVQMVKCKCIMEPHGPIQRVDL
jgi:hypothetical protein